MPLKRTRVPLVIVLLLLVLGTGVFCISYLVPRYVENNLLPDLGRRLASPLTGRVNSLGLGAAELGDVVLGDRSRPFVSIGSIRAEYSVRGLLAKKIDRIGINGLVIHVEIADGRIILPGLDPAKIALQASGKDSVQESSAAVLPLEPENFAIRSALVYLKYAGRLFLLPFNLTLQRNDGSGSGAAYDFTMQMLPQGEEIVLAGTIDLAGNRCFLTLGADSLDLYRFVGPGDVYDGHFHLAPIAVSGEASMSLQPLQLESASLSIDPGTLGISGIPVVFGPTESDTAHAVVLELKQEGDNLQLKAKGKIREPFAVQLDGTASVNRAAENIQSTGSFSIMISEPSTPEDKEKFFPVLENGTDFSGTFGFTRDESGNWQAEIKGAGLKPGEGRGRPIQMQYNMVSLQGAGPVLDIRGNGTPDDAEFAASLAISGVRVTHAGTVLQIPAMEMHSTFNRRNAKEGAIASNGTLRLGMADVKFQRNDLTGRADITFQADMSPISAGKSNTMQTVGTITLAKGEVADGASGLRLQDVAATVPWSWPPAPGEVTGKLELPRMQWQGNDLGFVRADVSLRNTTYTVSGSYTSRLFQGLVVKISGQADSTPGNIFGEFALHADSTPFAPIDLGRFDPTLSKAYFSGELALDGQLRIRPGEMQGSVAAGLQGGHFSYPEKKYEVKDISLSVHIPSLPDFRTGPAQTLHFSEASLGNLVFSDGKATWQLESNNSFFLEEAVVRWAGGRVFTNAVRISPAKKEIIVPIFCDRLKLTELLNQFGIGNAQGEGTVNGRIPLLVGKNSVRFEDGFLYSSPGESGSVKIGAFDILSAGIPKNTPQFAQVDFAAEALKNFQYNWVKLLLNSEDENLVLQMQMDGKPVQSLPFSYDSQTGMLQRTDGKGPGIDQPIRLDVNFRLPLNRFLGYSGKIQEIMKKIK